MKVPDAGMGAWAVAGVLSVWSGLLGVAAADTTAPAPLAEDFPRPPGDPAAIARGKQIFSVNCGFCHGSDARGGEGGPNLLRSPLVLNDRNGEAIYAVTLVGRPNKGMPKFSLGPNEVSDIAAFVHGIPTGGDEKTSFNPRDILVGNAAAGKRYFYGKGGCDTCHSVQGDLAHIGTRLDPKTIQDNIISGGVVSLFGAPLPSAPPRTATVALASGEIIRGTVISVDDFDISLTDSDGNRRTLPRHGAEPRVEIHNPMQAHLDKLREWEDRDIHNLTAFLVAQK
jgi:cytochrome c oxidase cbb3-type subunit III